ncbi:(5-formylfuran-3-yl)methyl phosphate synthase [Aquincola tertiaricarbonis]|uniref:(5-formylfuran-3-yl)methyl phosphate synthase n=1 Tax=Aquincola tertiaricarbonis TaxID=391953 RepID=A0ABY4S3E8_AQUTE|nr:(5-formylfuran-3-yl)methyl phosphate synthase [Aquincola tertiaricarbonis]URI05885.1 (5-formylfuran-3-yl)methyl phosphate synthase [Aquincola tertiaricarbonis]
MSFHLSRQEGLRLLVSVRTVEEAWQAAEGGADFIDLKEPRAGALGGLPEATLRAIVQSLRSGGSTLAISATIGDLPLTDLPAVMTRVHAVAACGVDIVKVGIPRTADGAPAMAALDALAACGHAIVPVFIADQGLDAAVVAHAAALGPRLAGVMVDTQDKLAGSLFDAMPMADLRHFVHTLRAAGQLVGLAGALRLQHLPAVLSLAPDFAGFRSAVCAGDRRGALEVARVRALRQALPSLATPGQAQVIDLRS